MARHRRALLAAWSGLAFAMAACNDAPTGPDDLESGGPLATSAAQTVIVAPADMNGWGFLVESGAPVGELVTGPGTAPSGNGSARLTAPASGDRMLLGTLAYAGTRLDAIDDLTYSTYRTSGGPALALALQFDVDTDLTDVNESFQGRLVYEPYYTHTVSTGAWQTWDTQDDAGTGNWWFSGAPGNLVCSIGNPCTWTEVLTAFPDAGIRDAGGIGALLFKSGGGWTGFDGNVDAFTISVIGGDATTFDFEPYLACTFTTSGTTMTLDGDCTTDATILVPHGFTLDGDGHTITAIDPAGGHFLGAVVKNAGAVAHVTNLSITTDDLANVCDGAGPPDNRLRGIFFDGAAGSITNNVVEDINQGSSGCQEGNAIEVRNMPFDGTHPNTIAVTISGNTVADYQKTGILANGDVAVDVSGNTASGLSPVPFIAQNGIQLGFGATGSVEDNSVDGNWFTGADWTSAGILLFQASNVDVKHNTVVESQTGIDAETWCWQGSGQASQNRIMKNDLSDAQYGIIVAAYDVFGLAACNPTANNNKVTNNTLTNSGSDGEIGIFVGTSDDNLLNAFTPMADNNKIVNNKIAGYATPIELDGDSTSKVHANKPSGP
jgi:hypothetical protein